MTRIFAAALAFIALSAGAASASNLVTVATDDIRTQRDASYVCQASAASSTWTGHWNTTRWAHMSVCNCAVGNVYQTRFDVEAGPIWNQRHAQEVCPTVCADTRWTGAWNPGTRRTAAACTLAYAGNIRGGMHIAPVAIHRPMPVVAVPAVHHPRRAVLHRAPARNRIAINVHHDRPVRYRR